MTEPNLKMRIEYHDTAPDRHGKRRFALHWVADGRAHAQEFHADPDYYIKKHNIREPK